MTDRQHGVKINAPITPAAAELLTEPALHFLAALHRTFDQTRRDLLHGRVERQSRLDAGERPDFLAETANIRASDWQIAPIPDEIRNRRVEITGPIDRKMIINALNSGANVFMADCEDATTPSWDNLVSGQLNLRDAVNRTISFTNEAGKAYRLNDHVAVLFVRPRGWHLLEKHVTVDGEPIAGGLFDFGLYLFHNAKTLLARGSAPYFYLPKLESHREARLWNDVFVFAQKQLGLPHGSIKATVLIETILAAFEMDEILYELRDHSAGLNCGRWDYIFSCIKKFAKLEHFVLADRAFVTMTSRFMRSYSLLAIKTCHRRGAHAMGGMAAQIPIKHDAQANAEALAKVQADKEREARDGHDGTWVAHPGLVPLAKAAFDALMPEANQIGKQLDVEITADDLLRFEPSAPITEQGLRKNISVGIQYIEAWLGGLGCVPLYNLMEDAATAEISRAQVWQWVHQPNGITEDFRKITLDWVRELVVEELATIEQEVGAERYHNGHYVRASQLFDQLVANPTFTEFLTLPAYEQID
ncbi:malate synthase A [Herpetosiphon geysericola]|uniref:Malate synthase n=1 Tax=Herpetosiphon geysericola TaxID=70996 RepID=A0A0P6YKJ8_9CHLR|nr:malate synthase A [Herpetosiphon geysericola]KPL90301.1 malate synthase [Herpetosiphon geysericola]